MAHLLREKMNSEKFYSVGYSKGLRKYVLRTCIPSYAYYNDYYEITKEEYEMFGTSKLDNIAASLFNVTSKSPRFLYSEKYGGDEEIEKKLLE